MTHVSYFTSVNFIYLNLVLKSFFKDVESKDVSIRSDNTTAITYINHKNCIQFVSCHVIGRPIWEWAIGKNIVISGELVPGGESICADKASRSFDENTE